MSDNIDTRHLQEQSREAVGEVPLKSDRLYQAPPAGSSVSGDAAAQHDDILYRQDWYSSSPRV